MRADFDWIPQQNDTTFFEPRHRSQSTGSTTSRRLVDRLHDLQLLDEGRRPTHCRCNCSHRTGTSAMY